MIKSEILVPLLNANEPDARLVGIHVKDCQKVKRGALLFTLETTKTTADVESTDAGYIRILVTEGDTLAVGERIAVITESVDERVDSIIKRSKQKSHLSEGNLRITKPARTLAEQLGVDLALLPINQLVTEDIIRKVAGSTVTFTLPVSHSTYPRILIYGGGGHAKTVIDMVRQMHAFEIVGIIDDHIPAGMSVLGITVLGTNALLTRIAEAGVCLAANSVGGISDIAVRVKVFELLEMAGFTFPSLVHKRATIEPSAIVEEGVQIFANAYIGSQAILHPRCIVNTNAVVSHDCEIGAYAHIAPGALLAGEVHVGERTLVGMGVTTVIGVKIGCRVRIGNGAILLADVPDKMIIQAGTSWIGKT